MTSWVGRVRAALRSRLWPLPTMVVVMAVGAGLLLPRFDAYIDGRLPRWLAAALFGGDSGAARTMLDAIAGSLITVTALTFSLTVVTLQLASSQFSPRLLRTFTRDMFVQATLALFLGTFAFSLAVLRSVRSADTPGGTGSGGTAFVPQFAVTGAFILALVSVIVLVLFLAHLARQIRVETMLQTVHDEASATANQVLGDRGHGAELRRVDDARASTVPRPDSAKILMAPGSGFLTYLDEEELLAAAIGVDVILVVDKHPGSFLVNGTPIGSYWAANHGELAGERRTELERRVQAAVHLGVERTESQDVGYGLRQLTDVAVKALSPGINDPTTAVHALDHTAALLCELASYDLNSRVLRDDDEVVRVVLHRPGFGDLLDVALTQPRRYGAADPAVIRRLFLLLAEVAWNARVEQHNAIAGQLSRLVDTAAAQNFDLAEVARNHDLERHVRRVMTGRWDSSERG